MSPQEQSERIYMLLDAITECILLGVSHESLEVIALESGISTKTLEQIINNEVRGAKERSS